MCQIKTTIELNLKILILKILKRYKENKIYILEDKKCKFSFGNLWNNIKLSSKICYKLVNQNKKKAK